MSNRLRTPPSERFYKKIEKTESCWLWTGASRYYGNFWDGLKYVNAHRFSYKINKGTIPKGMVVMHTCDTPLCVNPEHLKLGTQKDNLQDMYSKGRGRWAVAHV